MKNNFVYLIWNKITHKKYIGVKSSDLEPYDVIGKKYFSSSRDKDFINEQKEHPERFKYRVLKNFKSRKEAIELECLLHKKYDVACDEKFYNRACQTSVGFDTGGVKYSDERKQQISKCVRDNLIEHPEIREKISKKSKEWWETHPEAKERLIKFNTERIHTEEEKEKSRLSRLDPLTGQSKYSGKNASFYGKKHTEEYKKKMSELLTGRTLSEETKRKLSESHKGKTHTEETKRKLSEIGKGKAKPEGFSEKISQALKGRAISENAKQKLSEKAKQRIKDHQCEFCGKFFTKQAYRQHHGEKCILNPKRIKTESPLKGRKRPKDCFCEVCQKWLDKGNFMRHHNGKCDRMKILDFNDYLGVLKSQELSETLDFNDEIESIEEVDPIEMVDISLDGNNVFYANDILIHNCAINKVEGVDNTAVSDSYSTNATADFMCFVLQNEQMKANSEVIIKITKNRYTGMTDTFMMNVDYPKMRFKEILQNEGQPENALTQFATTQQKADAEKEVKSAIIEDNKANNQIAKEHDKKVSQGLSSDELNALLGL